MSGNTLRNSGVIGGLLATLVLAVILVVLFAILIAYVKPDGCYQQGQVGARPNIIMISPPAGNLLAVTDTVITREKKGSTATAAMPIGTSGSNKDKIPSMEYHPKQQYLMLGAADVLLPLILSPDSVSPDNRKSSAFSSCAEQAYHSKIDSVVVTLVILIWIAAIFFSVFVKSLAERLKKYITIDSPE